MVRAEELLTSSQVAQRLMATGQSAAAARQQIARTARKSKDIWRSSALQLPRRERLFAPRAAVGTVKFLHQAEIVLAKTRPGVSRCLAALLQHQTILKPEAERLLAVAGPAAYAREEKALADLGISVNPDDGTALARLSLPFVGDTRSLARARYQRLLRETQIVRIVIEHLRRQSLVSWSGNNLPEGPLQLPRFTGYPFTAFGWSWLAPLVRWEGKKPSPMPVLVDVFGGECDIFDVGGYLARHARIRAISRQHPRLLGVIAAQRFTKDAHYAARSAGLMIINLRAVFGDAALDLMAEMSTLLDRTLGAEGPDLGGADGIEKVALALDRLQEHPFVKDLRSLGLETLSALVARLEGWEDVKVGISVPFQKETTREVDLHGLTHGGRRAIVVECKAHHTRKALAPEDVRKFFTETVPAFIDHHQAWNIEECHAEIWTTGTVEADAQAMLAQLPLNKRVRPLLVDGAGLEQRVPHVLEPCRRLLRTIAAAE